MTAADPTGRLPTAAMAYNALLAPFTDADLEALRTVCVLDRAEPISGWQEPGLAERLAAVEVLVTHWGCPPIDAEVLDLAPELGLIAHTAGSVRRVVTDDVWSRGIRVTSAAAANAVAVAEYTLAAILLANKDAFVQMARQSGGGLMATMQPADFPVGNRDKQIGVVGASRIGRRVIEHLERFPELSVGLFDPFVDGAEAAAMGVRKLDLETLCRTSHVLTIHAPALPSTHHMIGAAQLELMPTGATLINTARASLVDQDALLAEVEHGRLRAVLDVTDPEPVLADSPLRSLGNVVITPHMAGSQGTEMSRLVELSVEEIRRFAAGEPALHQVTRADMDVMA